MGANKQLLKGDSLEEAVEKIQSLILRTNPAFQNSNFTIERKKLIFPGDVKREIDLYVKVDPGNDMDSIFIFECKNWNSPVDANSITIFNTKITETNATKGFFIAKTYSKDAVKEAKKYPRLFILKATEDYIDLSPFPHMHMTLHNSDRIFTMEIIEKGILSNEGSTNKIEIGKVIYQGEKIPVQEFFNPIYEETIDQKMKTEMTQFLDEGIYKYSYHREIDYEDGKLLINQIEVEKIIIDVDFEIQIVKPIIISKFDIESKGRYLKQEFNMPLKGKLELISVAIK